MDERQVVMMFAAMKAMRYDAIGVGVVDLRFLPTFLKASQETGVQTVHIGPSDIPGTVPYIIKKVGATRVGIVSFGAVDPKDDGFELRKRRYATFRAVRAESDVLILLDQARVATDEWLQRNAERFGAPDIVIGGEATAYVTEPKIIGKTHVLPTSMEARFAGLAKVEIAADKSLKIGYTRTSLDENFAEDQDVKKMIEDYRRPAPAATAAAPAG